MHDRRVPDHLREQSIPGSIFTILTIAISQALIVYNFLLYRKEMVRQTISMDEHQEDQIRINLNISLMAIPCKYATLDASDYVGMRLINITRHIRRYQIATKAKQSQRIQQVIMQEPEKGLQAWGALTHNVQEGVFYSQPLLHATFADFMKKYELVLVNFYAPWCPFCHQLNPEWERAAAQLRDHPEYSETVAMASVDCTDPEAVVLCRRAHVRAFPSMLIYIYGRTFTRFIYSGAREAGKILQFLDLFYRKLEPDMDYAEETYPQSFSHHEVNLENVHAIGASIKDGIFPKDSMEGCELSGSLSMQRVPSKLIITARSKEHSFAQSDMNMTHTVHHFSFGQMKRNEHLMDGENRDEESKRYPLDHKVFTALESNITMEHYLDVIGIDHHERPDPRTQRIRRTYEFVANSNEYMANDALPSAIFSFDISPLVIEKRIVSVPFYRFITSLCAIIGGTFTVIGLIDSGVFHAMNTIKKKQQLGKLH